MAGGFLFIAVFLLPFSVFLWGLAGLLLDYYRIGDRILTGKEARAQNLKIMLLSGALMGVSSLTLLYVVRAW
jgi:hypothetical protein